MYVIILCTYSIMFESINVIIMTFEKHLIYMCMKYSLIFDYIMTAMLGSIVAVLLWLYSLF